jgi:peptidoglycan hydrolase-like protein with peptidoglycan-binding domain
VTTRNTIRLTDKGPDVELAQYELCRGLFLFGPSDVDGDFGPQTEQAVYEYQSANGLSADGVIGPLTWAQMLSQHADPPTLAEGSHGAVVSGLQQLLNTANIALAEPLSVDAQFGPLTKHAVAALQAANNTPADGIIGYKTWVIHIGGGNAMVASQVGV